MRIPSPYSAQTANALAPDGETRIARASRRLAFTLVEILVAMGIFSLVLAAIYSTWTAILRASKTGLEAAAAVQRARMAGRTIEESLGSAMCFMANQSNYFFLADNSGSKPYLSFVARLAPSFPRQGKFGDFTIRRVTFSVEPSAAGGKQLVLRQCPLLRDPDKDEDEQKHPLVLAKNVREFSTEFWDQRLEDWVDEWKMTNQLPALVKVTLKLADNPYSTHVREQVVRVVSIPSVAVRPEWQGAAGNMPIRPGMPGALPGMPGGLPGASGYPGGPGSYPSQQQPSPGKSIR